MERNLHSISLKDVKGAVVLCKAREWGWGTGLP